MKVKYLVGVLGLVVSVSMNAQAVSGIIKQSMEKTFLTGDVGEDSEVINLKSLNLYGGMFAEIFYEGHHEYKVVSSYDSGRFLREDELKGLTLDQIADKIDHAPSLFNLFREANVPYLTTVSGGGYVSLLRIWLTYSGKFTTCHVEVVRTQDSSGKVIFPAQ